MVAEQASMPEGPSSAPSPQPAADATETPPADSAMGIPQSASQDQSPQPPVHRIADAVIRKMDERRNIEAIASEVVLLLQESGRLQAHDPTATGAARGDQERAP